jgi:hypothetical protein
MPFFRPRIAPLSGNIEPCLPRPAKEPPAGPDWIHEIKHDGFRVAAQCDGSRVRLTSRNSHDLTYRFPLIAAAIARLPVRSCLIDGEAVVCDENGLAVFQLIGNFRHGNAATLCAFDLIEVNGEDLRREPIEDRKLALNKLLGQSHPGIAYNRHFNVGPRRWLFRRARKARLEGGTLTRHSDRNSSAMAAAPRQSFSGAAARRGPIAIERAMLISTGARCKSANISREPKRNGTMRMIPTMYLVAQRNQTAKYLRPSPTCARVISGHDRSRHTIRAMNYGRSATCERQGQHQHQKFLHGHLRRASMQRLTARHG